MKTFIKTRLSYDSWVKQITDLAYEVACSNEKCQGRTNKINKKVDSTTCGWFDLIDNSFNNNLKINDFRLSLRIFIQFGQLLLIQK